MNWYDLSRKRFNFTFENPEKVNCNHTALYFYIIDKRNRFWQKEKFWLPALYTMEVLGIKSKNTYYKIFNDLILFWFIKIVQKATNQNTSNIISIKSASSKNKSALIQHIRQREDSTISSGGNIYKQINKEINKQVLGKITTEFFLENMIRQELEKMDDIDKKIFDKSFCNSFWSYRSEKNKNWKEKRQSEKTRETKKRMVTRINRSLEKEKLTYIKYREQIIKKQSFNY